MAKSQRRSEAIWIESKKYWQVKVQKDGVRKAFTSSITGKRGKHDAEGKADDWLESNTSGDIKFEAAWKIFMEHTKETTGTANYNNRDSLGRTWLLPTLKKKKLSMITQYDMQSCINNASKAGKSKRMCVNIRSTLMTFSKYARTCRWPLEQPYDMVIPRGAPVGQRKILQPDGLGKLFTFDTVTRYGKYEQAFFIYAWRLTVVLGLRRGELCGLKWADLSDGILHIDRAINNINEVTRGKNENARRYIALPEIAKNIVDEQREMLKKSGLISPWMFPDEYGERLDSNHLYKCWSKYRNQHGLDCSLHELRHTFISIVKSDMPVALLKATVGHSEDMDTFGVYGHEVDGDMQQTANIIDKVFTRLLPSKTSKQE